MAPKGAEGGAVGQASRSVGPGRGRSRGAPGRCGTGRWSQGVAAGRAGWDGQVADWGPEQPSGSFVRRLGSGRTRWAREVERDVMLRFDLTEGPGRGRENGGRGRIGRERVKCAWRCRRGRRLGICRKTAIRGPRPPGHPQPPGHSRSPGAFTANEECLHSSPCSAGPGSSGTVHRPQMKRRQMKSRGPR